MKISRGLKEKDVIIGNTYDKYGSRNHIVKLLMHGFDSIMENIIKDVNPETIHEVGCGEGYHTIKWMEKGFNATGSDFSTKIIDIAKTNAKERQLPEDNFFVSDIYELDPVKNQAQLVVCSEVLEHLTKPEQALCALREITTDHLIISVPQEPIWSILNMARGKYWSDFGNTPGHIQRWTKKEIVKLVSERFLVEKIFTPIPWTILLCK